MQDRLFSTAASVVLVAGLVGLVVFGVVAAGAIEAVTAVTTGFFWLLGYVWLPILVVVGLMQARHYRRRWVVAGLYAVLTGLIVWAYGWPLPLILLAAVAQGALWMAISIPLVRRYGGYRPDPATLTFTHPLRPTPGAPRLPGQR